MGRVRESTTTALWEAEAKELLEVRSGVEVYNTEDSSPFFKSKRETYFCLAPERKHGRVEVDTDQTLKSKGKEGLQTPPDRVAKARYTTLTTRLTIISYTYVCVFVCVYANMHVRVFIYMHTHMSSSQVLKDSHTYVR